MQHINQLSICYFFFNVCNIENRRNILQTIYKGSCTHESTLTGKPGTRLIVAGLLFFKPAIAGLPVPNWPALLLPQHLHLPSVTSTHVWSGPVATAVATMPAKRRRTGIQVVRRTAWELRVYWDAAVRLCFNAPLGWLGTDEAVVWCRTWRCYEVAAGSKRRVAYATKIFPLFLSQVL